jgi:hypothetical protein
MLCWGKLGTCYNSTMAESSEGVSKGITKRRFLKATAAAAVGVGVVALGYEANKHTETKIDFSTDSVDYRFLGGSHGSDYLRQFDIINPLSALDVPADTTVFQMETGTFPYLDPEYSSKMNKVYEFVSEDPFFKGPGQLLSDKKVPMILTDIPASLLDPELATTILGSLAPGIGLFLMGRKEKNPTRRKFLLGGALAFLSFGGTRVTSGDVLAHLQRASSEPWAQKIAKLNHQVELSKPDDLLRTFRNCIISAKTLGLESRLPVNPETSRARSLLLYGSAHLVLPEYIKGGKQSILEYLSLYPKSFIDKTFGLDNPHLYTSAILTPNVNGEVKVESLEDKDLKSIFQ